MKFSVHVIEADLYSSGFSVLYDFLFSPSDGFQEADEDK